MRTRRRFFWVTCIIGVGFLVIGLIIATYRLHWVGTGFLDKTLWDWMQLLIVPAVLTAGAFLFNLAMSRNEQRASKRREETDRAIALDNQREIALQAYFDKMSELLLEKNLRQSQPEDEVRSMARARTLTVLCGLDGKRKRSLLQFLSEAHLIPHNRTAGVLNLKGADLSSIDMTSTDLSDTILEEVDMEGADLRWANLRGIILVKAHLTRSWLIRADLSEADLREAFLGAAHLSGVNLRGANLRGAKLIQADLSNADLSNADLRDVYLGEADLRGADFRGANLRGASLYKANLKGAKVTPDQLDVTTDEEKMFKW